MNMTRLLIILIFIHLLSGCGLDADEEREEAILSANIFLSSRKCDEAINVLETAGRANSDATYLQTLASAYACKAGYNEPTIFGTDMAKMGTPSIIGGMTKFTIAPSMTSPDATSFTSMQTAIDILLYAGGLARTTSPTPTKRAEGFTALEAGDINIQLLFMIFAQMGQYFHFYGNSSTTGMKGSGTNPDFTNNCLVNYDQTIALQGGTIAQALQAGGTGSCDDTEAGHINMGVVGSLNVERMCHGVILFNNLKAIFAAVGSDVAGGDFGSFDIADLDDQITELVDNVVAPGDATGVNQVVAVYAQDICETENAATSKYLEIYFLTMFENEVLFK